MVTLNQVTQETLTRLGCEVHVDADDETVFAYAVGLARMYNAEDRAIEQGKVDMADAFFVQPGRTPTFWPFFGYGRDREAMEGWWEYAHRHAQIQDDWWRSVLARLLAGQSMGELDGRPADHRTRHRMARLDTVSGRDGAIQLRGHRATQPWPDGGGADGLGGSAGDSPRPLYRSSKHPVTQLTRGVQAEPGRRVRQRAVDKPAKPSVPDGARRVEEQGLEHRP